MHHDTTYRLHCCCSTCRSQQERRIALAAGEAVPQDLLGVLLTAADERGQHMTDEELWEDVHDVMGAGAPLLVVVLGVCIVTTKGVDCCVPWVVALIFLSVLSGSP